MDDEKLGRWLSGGRVLLAALCLVAGTWALLDDSLSEGIVASIACLAAVLSASSCARLLADWRENHLEGSRSRVALSLASLFAVLTAGARWIQVPPSSWAIVTIAVTGVACYFAAGIARVFSRSLRSLDHSADEMSPLRFDTRLPTRAVAKLLSGDGEATAFLITREGHLVTNAHCVMGAPTLEVVLANDELFEARPVIVKPEWDLALIKIDAPYPLPTARLGDSVDAVLGERTVTLGREPWSMRSNAYLYTPNGSLRAGQDEVVAVPGAVAGFSESSEESFSVLHVASNDVARPGYSGAPVCLARKGQVIGVHAGGYGSLDMKQVIPVDLVGAMLEEAGVSARHNRIFWRMPQQSDPESVRRRWLAGAPSFEVWLFDRFNDLDSLKEPDALEYVRSTTDEYLAKVPESPAVQTMHAWASLAEGKVEAARAAARRAIESGSVYNAVRVLRESATTPEMHEENLAVAEQALARLPAGKSYLGAKMRASFHRMRVHSLAELERWEDLLIAAEAGRADLSEAGHAFGTLYYSADALLKLGRFAEAIERFDAAKEAASSADSASVDWMGYLRALLGEGSDRSLRRALDFGRWCLTRGSTPPEAFRLAAEAAERLDLPNLAGAFREWALVDANVEPEAEPKETEESGEGL